MFLFWCHREIDSQFPNFATYSMHGMDFVRNIWFLFLIRVQKHLELNKGCGNKRLQRQELYWQVVDRHDDTSGVIIAGYKKKLALATSNLKKIRGQQVVKNLR